MFVFSKLVHFLVQPLHIVLAMTAAGLLLQAVRLRRLGAAVLSAAATVVCVVSLTPVGSWLAYGLENRVARGAFDLETVAGAIILGGATGDPRLVEKHGTYMINDGAERLTTLVALRRQRPDLTILVSGGSGRLLQHDIREPEITRLFLADMGIDPATVLFEERSRNTYENAIYSAEMLAERPGPYLLVTSAYHMPRALGCFRRAGVEVIPYPVDYRIGRPSWAYVNPAARFSELDFALQEIVGLVSYRLLGRTDALLPSARN